MDGSSHPDVALEPSTETAPTRGILFGLLFSVPIWVLLGLGVRFLFRH